MFFIKKKFICTILIFILIIILIYVINITTIPNNIILFKNDEITLPTIAGIKVKEVKDKDAIQASTVDEKNKNINNRDYFNKEYYISLLGINLKKVKANVVEKRKVIPLGNIVGLKLYTKGVLVVGTSEIEGEDRKIYKPYEEAGIEQGDSILKVNNENIDSTEKLLECISNCKGNTINLTYLKNDKELNGKITPVKVSKHVYKLGIWVRDAAAGIGTLTFYDKLTNSVISLGHGIQDIDTGNMVEISSGEFVTSKVENIEKGRKNTPGKIRGNIENSEKIGKIYNNTNFGICGYIENRKKLNIDKLEEIDVALRNEIKEGEAIIKCSLDNEKTEEYKINIQKIFKNNNDNNKSMIIKIIDKKLLNKTGGIIQGMSGSPIIQNGKLVGALTHVLVSDPTVGYGVFADLMLSRLK